MCGLKMFHTVFLGLCLWRLVGVFGDAVASVPVTEGDSVTLESGVAQIHTRELITWTFGMQKTQIAGIDKASGTFSTYDVLDGRFRDRLKLDYQTGSLTITDTRTTDSGLYMVYINGKNPTTCRFDVTVYGSPSHPASDHSSPYLMVLISAVAAGSLLIVAIIGLCCICMKHRDHEDKTDPTLYKLTGHTESEMAEVIYMCFTENNDQTLS